MKKGIEMKITLLILALLTGLISAATFQAQNKDVTTNAWVKMSPFDRASLVTFFNVAQGRPLVDANPTDQFIAAFRTETAQYAVLNVEFKSPVACKVFDAPGAHVAYRFDRFADVFIDRTEALLALEKHPDVRWIDVAVNPYAPPPSLVALSKEKPRERESLIHGGIDVRVHASKCP